MIGCASTPDPGPTTRTVTEVRLPPESLTQDCLVPAFTGADTGDLLDWALELRAELVRCNIDKALLRQWREEHGNAESASP